MALGTLPSSKPTIVFFHAHPDDEAIFTGGTIAKLVDQGERVVVVIATDGDLGVDNDQSDSNEPGRLAQTRAAEAAEACRLLGVDRLHFLGFADSGMASQATSQAVSANAFALCNLYEAAEQLSEILVAEGANVLVHYDEDGIYGHADHLAVHRVGRRAAKLARLETVYEATVDHEHLHFVETHLVGHAIASLHESAVAGVPTALVTTTVDVGDVVGLKRKAMAAHQSQIGSESEAMQLDSASFEAVYGIEWYVRSGPLGPLDSIGM